MLIPIRESFQIQNCSLNFYGVLGHVRKNLDVCRPAQKVCHSVYIKGISE